jgi:deoxyguanosine kinase
MNNPGYIVIEGNIGAGKTSLAYNLAKDMKGKFVPERFTENPFLQGFYENPQKYAFPVELSFLADRYQQLKNELLNRDLFNPLVISDYYFSKSLIFARITLKEDEFRLYRQLFDIIHEKLPLPDLYIFLYQPIEKLLDNIKARGRSYEQSISPEYLKNIQEGYLNYLKNIQNMKVVIIDATPIDFVNKSPDYEKIKDLIMYQDFRKGINRVSF